MLDAATLDARILTAIAAYALDAVAFRALALDLFAYQIAHNAPYAAFVRAQGAGALAPARVEDIPAVPAAAFKEARLATFPPHETVLWFETSGTTGDRAGRHELPTMRLYEAALLASFDRMLLADGARLRYLNLVPDPHERPHSSLGFMLATVARERGDGRGGWYLRGDELDVDRFVRDVARAGDDGAAVCLAITAFALVALLDALGRRGRDLALPPGSRIMETGGFKGRTRVVERTALYTEASARLRVPLAAIVAEYGMTELSSQYYDGFASRARIEPRVKVAPPWRRPTAPRRRRRRDPPRRPGEPRFGRGDRDRGHRRARRPFDWLRAGRPGAARARCGRRAARLLARRRDPRRAPWLIAPTPASARSPRAASLRTSPTRRRAGATPTFRRASARPRRSRRASATASR